MYFNKRKGVIDEEKNNSNVIGNMLYQQYL